MPNLTVTVGQIHVPYAGLPLDLFRIPPRIEVQVTVTIALAPLPATAGLVARSAYLIDAKLIDEPPPSGGYKLRRISKNRLSRALHSAWRSPG